MWEYSQITVSFLVLLLQVTFINTKSQLFTLKNNKIVMFNQNIEIDEIFQIISKSEEKSGSFEFSLLDLQKLSDRNSSHEKADENGNQFNGPLDCDRPVMGSIVDDLIGISKRKELKTLPEPDVLWTFKSKSSRQKTSFDVDALELKLRKEKRDKPRSVQIYNKIGNFARIKGNSFVAIECYRKALSINPTNSEVILNLARLLFHHGYLEDAIYLTRKSLEVHNAATSAWRQYFTLGEIFKKYGNIQESILHLRHALELSPKNDKVLEALMEIEKIPISSLHVMTVLIITVLVLGVLLVLRCFWLQDDEPSSEKRDKRCFKFRVSKVRVIRKK